MRAHFHPPKFNPNKITHLHKNLQEKIKEGIDPSNGLHFDDFETIEELNILNSNVFEKKEKWASTDFYVSKNVTGHRNEDIFPKMNLPASLFRKWGHPCRQLGCYIWNQYSWA